MMSSATTQRAGRAPKDKNKPQPSHSTAKTPTEASKSSDGMVSKILPTAEQLRIAQIINDANKGDYPDLKDKVERIIEITGKTSDAALVALHDCDNDSNRAAIMLLEGNQDEGKWETSGKKKKNRQSQQKAPEVNGHEPAPAEEKEKETVENSNRRREPKQRDGGYRYRGPPRLNRGNQGRNWKNKENEKNERNVQQDGQVRRERNSTEGRSRGPRRNFTSGRGRGRGGRSRTFQNRGLQNNDGFPESIDTWQNSTAEKVSTSNPGDSTMTVGNWSDVAVPEEWSEEDWTENLTETKVFTPSAGTQQSAVSALDIPAPSALGQNIDLTSFLQKPSANTENSSNSLSTSSVAQPGGQSSLMSQQMPPMQQNVQMQSQGHFDFTQFAKEAADQIKAAVGVGTQQPTPSAPSVNANSYQSSGSAYPSSYAGHVQMPHELSSQSGFSTATLSQPATAVASQPAPLPQRATKPPKARLPPPSKIPESAVVMPDDAVTSLDVQFGTALQFGTDASSFDFTSGGDTNSSYQDLGQNSNGSSLVNSQAMPSSITSQSYSNPLPSPVTMSKDSTYSIGSHSSPSQNSISSDLSQSQKVANQESLLLSQSEHKTVENVSSYVNHRSNQSSNLEGSMMSSKAADQSALNSFSTSSHDSAYSYGSQKSVLNSSNLAPSSSVSYSNPSAAALSGGEQASSQPKYQAQQQSQNQAASSYVSAAASSYGLQQTAYSGPVTTSGSSYPSQSGYSSHASASYGTSNSGYSNQQGVYSGSVTTTTQSGTMISTSVSSSKLTNSLNHGVKDSSLLESQHTSSQQQQHSYEVPSSSTTSSSSVLSAAPASSAVNHSAQQQQQNSSAGMLGLVSTSSSTTTTSVLKNSLSASKAVPNIPQNMPMLGHQYIMGQASLPFYGLQQPVYSYEDMQVLQSKLGTVGLQSPVAYSYEDMQMLQSKLSTLGYYDMQFPAPTSMTGRDPGMGSVAYTTDGKYSRAETDASTVATTLSQGQANTQAHGQAFLNPTLPPGYGYYFAGGMMTGGIPHYAPPIFPVPPATNTHGATTNTQFQKANAYGSHSYNSGYESLSQAQDYSKGTYGAASQNQVKGVSGSGAVPDLSGSVYSKTHAQLAKYNDKPGFHTGTPPPFNQAGGPMGASSGPYATQFIPVLAHGQHHSTALLHHHLQDQPAGQRPAPPPKSSSKQNYAYWTSN